MLDGSGTPFVSVTQSFNTATGMRRLSLNKLLKFAQLEREITAKQNRDKIATPRRKGLWMDGLVLIGYDADGWTLNINKIEDAVTNALRKAV